MSYDLYFTAPKISREQFASHFAGNPRYEVSPGQAVYKNKDTGVYFSFDFNDPIPDDPEEIACSASFNLNYYRPHYFGLEAVEEVTRFVEHFGFSVHDPQMDGMGDGPYSPDAFLKGWNHGNAFGYSAILRGQNSPAQVWSLPTPGLEAIWHWNYLKKKHQEALSQDVFVPRIFFIPMEGAVKSMVVWPDAISELIPEVDFVYVERNALAPKPFFGSRKKDTCTVPFEQARTVLAPYRTEEYSMPAFQLPAPQTPKAVRDFVRSLRPTVSKLSMIAPDQILNSELVEKAKRG